MANDEWIGQCCCKQVGAIWRHPSISYPVYYRFSGMTDSYEKSYALHSPVGCWRETPPYQTFFDLYRRMTGFNYSGPFGTLYQMVMTKLKDHPEIAKDLPVVLWPVPCHQMVKHEVSPPMGVPGVGRGLVRVPKEAKSPTLPPIWSQETGKIKPPWEK